MEPFSIVCKSCAARLKVAKPSAVGQILACPKCGTMIEVIAPQGWVAPESPAQTSLESTGEFDDIEQVLSETRKPTIPPPAARSKSKNAARSRPASQSQPTSAQNVATAIDQPVLPNDQWTSDETRKRKRMVTTIAGIVGALFLMGALVAAILFNRSKPQPEVADKSANAVEFVEEENSTVAAENPDELLHDGNLLDEAPDIAVPSSNKLDVGEAPPVLPDVAEEIPEQESPEVAMKEPSDSNDQEVSVSNSPPTTTQSPFGDPNKGPLDVEPIKPEPSTSVGMVEAFENDLGDLTALLEQNNTSVLEFKDLTASIRNQPVVGLPKYSIDRPDESKLDLEKQLAIPIGGLKFDSAPLAQIVRDLSSITGVPITIDARSIVAAGKAPNPQTSTKLSDTNLNDALTQLLTPLDIYHVSNATGLTIGVFNSQAEGKATFDLPDVPDIDLEGRKRFLATIQMLIEPEIWSRQNDPATIELLNNQIVVNCSQSVQDQIGRLIAKLKASLVLTQSVDNAEAIKATQTRWKSVATNLAKDPGLLHSVQTEIGSFLNKLHSKTGVTVLVDWRNVINKGWTPQTIVPGNIREVSVDKVVAELARSMDLSVRAVDANTLMLTSFEQSAQTVDLEVYPVSKLLAGKLNEQQLTRLVNEALGAQMRSERVRFLYEPNCECLIVSAPQSLQQQIEALIDRLRGI